MVNKDDNGDMLQGLKHLSTPFTIIIAPIFGYFLGYWLDKLLRTSPYLSFFFLIIGLGSGIREMYKLLKQFKDN